MRIADCNLEHLGGRQFEIYPPRPSTDLTATKLQMSSGDIPGLVALAFHR